MAIKTDTLIPVAVSWIQQCSQPTNLQDTVGGWEHESERNVQGIPWQLGIGNFTLGIR